MGAALAAVAEDGDSSAAQGFLVDIFVRVQTHGVLLFVPWKNETPLERLYSLKRGPLEKRSASTNHK
jgi:hypothetical protein